MPRTKAFSPHEALSTAAQLFWDLGYEKTSLDTLMSRTGVARQSLYDTFGDKRSLYLQSLAHYRDTSQAALRRLFASGRPIRECFSKVLLGIAAESKAAHLRGCLLLSANLEREAGERIDQVVRREPVQHALPFALTVHEAGVFENRQVA